jgi:outer membrane protein TolC
VLLGRPPGSVLDSIDTNLPVLPPLPQTGLPLQLINKRPDIQSAFYRLQASDREVAAAISNKYPRLNFSLTAAIRSNTFSNLFQSQAISLSAGLLAPIFYGGRLSALVDQTEAVRGQRLNEYGQTILIAFHEVENALIQEIKQTERITVINEQVTLAERTNGQLRIEYLNGSIPYLDVLVALNQEQQLRRDLISATATLLEIRVSLYRALAGGFTTEREIQEEES